MRKDFWSRNDAYHTVYQFAISLSIIHRCYRYYRSNNLEKDLNSHLVDLGIQILCQGFQISNKLQVLNLTNCKITDIALRSISCLTNLQTLAISYCYNVTDVGLEYISHLKLNLSLLGCNCAAGKKNLSTLTIQNRGDPQNIFKTLWYLLS